MNQVVSYQYDLAGRRTRVTWPDSFYAQYDYDLTGAVTAIRENGASSGVGVLATYAYDNLGRRTGVTRGNGVTTTYSYDAASRLSQLSQNLAGSSDDLTLGFSYNAAGQAVSRTGMTGAYAWPQPSINAEMYAANGRNQYTNVGGANFTYDARGNLTATGSATYGYDAFNRLTSAGSASLSYDPAGRLYQVSASPNTTRFLYDGLDAIAEYNGSNTMLRRYVHGPSFDEPIVWYEGSGTSDRRWLVADQLGSVVAATNASGNLIGSPNTYDEYGRPGPNNTGRFQYTGQMWLSEAGVYHYKARAYAPAIGAFLQTDPILYAGGMNLYMCAAADPVNNVDPLGLDEEEAELVINGVRWRSFATVGDLFAAHGSSASPYTPLSHGETVDEIVVTAKQQREAPARYDQNCLYDIDRAARMIWEGQRSAINGTTLVFASTVVLTGSITTANPYTAYYSATAGIGGGFFWTWAGLHDVQRGKDLLWSYSLEETGNQIQMDAIRSMLPFSQTVLTLPSRTSAREVCRRR